MLRVSFVTWSFLTGGPAHHHTREKRTGVLFARVMVGRAPVRELHVTNDTLKMTDDGQ